MPALLTIIHKMPNCAFEFEKNVNITLPQLLKQVNNRLNTFSRIFFTKFYVIFVLIYKNEKKGAI